MIQAVVASLACKATLQVVLQVIPLINIKRNSHTTPWNIIKLKLRNSLKLWEVSFKSNEWTVRVTLIGLLVPNLIDVMDDWDFDFFFSDTIVTLTKKSIIVLGYYWECIFNIKMTNSYETNDEMRSIKIKLLLEYTSFWNFLSNESIVSRTNGHMRLIWSSGRQSARQCTETTCQLRGRVTRRDARTAVVCPPADRWCRRSLLVAE